jgi:hypothetical protein
LATEYPQLGKGPYWQSAEAAVHIAAGRFSAGNHASVFHASGSAALAWALDHMGPGRNEEQNRPVFKSRQARQTTHAAWLCDIFGNPFRAAPSIDRKWLRWNDGTVVRLAAAIYDERSFDRMPVLADALRDSGCDSGEIFGHLRQRGQVHVRGCWVLDLLLGKS